ncbi:MAG: PDZ domain-containing protein, partial [bacterium]|nr:PDZ domain-containing protein [bacterium]
MFEAALNQVQRNIPEVLAQCEKKDFCSVTVNQATKRFKYPSKELSSLQSGLKGVLAFIALHIDKDTDKEEVEASVIEGVVYELDPHSTYLSADVYREFRVGTEGEFGGLGIVIGLKEGRLTVTAPLEGTPAWRAGVKSGDAIVQINDESTVNMTLTEAVERLRGPVGTKVTLKIERSGRNTPLTMTLKRALINIEAVQSKVVKTPKGENVAFLRVKS